MTIEIRPALPSDAQQILSFITELADYEKARHEVIASVADIQRSLFGEGATAHGLICLRDGLPIGFAVFFFSYSTWLGSNCLYLEDLYVKPEHRGAGIVVLLAALKVEQFHRKAAITRQFVSRIEQRMEYRISIETRQATPYQACTAVDKRTDGAIADYRQIERRMSLRARLLHLRGHDLEASRIIVSRKLSSPSCLPQSQQ